MKGKIIFVLLTSVLVWISSVTIVRSQDQIPHIEVRSAIENVLNNLPGGDFFSQSRQDKIGSRSEYWAQVNLDESIEEFTNIWNDLAQNFVNKDSQMLINEIPDFMLFEALLVDKSLASKFTQVASEYSKVKKIPLGEVVRKWAAVGIFYHSLWCVWPFCCP